MEQQCVPFPITERKTNVHNFIKHFVRKKPGVWCCRKAAELELQQGRIQVTPGTRFTLGSTFMGVELAKLLEDEYKKSQPR
jgi:hypothetical protein